MAERRPVQVDGRATQAKLLDNDGFPAALCDPPDDCSTCMLFGEDTPEWRERVRQAFQAAPEPSSRRGGRGQRRQMSIDNDARLLSLLSARPMTMHQLGAALGCTSMAAAQLASRARRRGVPIENVRGRGYRLKLEQSA